MIMHPSFRMVDEWWATQRRALQLQTGVLVGLVALVVAGSVPSALWRRASQASVVIGVGVGLYMWWRARSHGERLQYNLNCKVEMQLGQMTPVSCNPPWAQ